MKEGWDYRKLGDVCAVLNGFAFKSGKYADSGTRVIRITNVQKGFIVDDDPKYYPSKEMQGLNQYILKENDLLMSLTGNVGRVGLLQKELLPAALNQRVACLRIKDSSLSLRFLFHWLNSTVFEQDAIFSASGIAQKNLSTEWLKSYKIGIPPLSEQQHIIEELDLLSSIIEKKKAQLKELDNLAQSLFYEMFGDPISNEKGWEVRKLNDIYKLKSGDGLSAKNFVEGIYPVYGGNGISGYHNAYNMNGDFIIIGRVGAYCGNVRYVKGLFWLTDNAFQLFFDANIQTPVFVLYLLTLLDLHRFANEAAQPVISNKTLRDLDIIIPTMEMQEQFASKIEAIEHQKELIKQSIKEVETLFNSRMDYYFN